MARETSPCSAETALARRESFSPSTVMQNCSSWIPGIFAAELHELIVGKAQLFAERSEVLFDQVGAEAVVARGNRACGW